MDKPMKIVDASALRLPGVRRATWTEADNALVVGAPDWSLVTTNEVMKQALRQSMAVLAQDGGETPLLVNMLESMAATVKEAVPPSEAATAMDAPEAVDMPASPDEPPAT